MYVKLRVYARIDLHIYNSIHSAYAEKHVDVENTPRNGIPHNELKYKFQILLFVREGRGRDREIPTNEIQQKEKKRGRKINK